MGASTSLSQSGPESAAEVPHRGLIVRDVARSFGTVHALRGVSLDAVPGEVTALVGPNGCGKSTLMLMIASLLSPDSGQVLVGGHDPQTESTEVRRLVGWMPDVFGTWDALTVTEVLTTIGGAFFMPKAKCRARAAELLDTVHLSEFAASPAHVLSRGQKQRLGLARALMHSPQILVLDEPASGLDPTSRIELRILVRALAAEGKTVLISSHILSELEEMSDRVVVMDRGADVSTTPLRARTDSGTSWTVTAFDGKRLATALEELGYLIESMRGADHSRSGHAEARVRVKSPEQASSLLRELCRADAGIVSFGPSTGLLEAAYLESGAGRGERK